MKPIYLAAPFFNEQQLAVVVALETWAAARGFDFISPRLQHPQDKPPPKITTREHAIQVLEYNHRHIRQSGLVVAVLDWRMPSKHELRVVERSGLDHNPHIAVSPPLSIPDSGTVYECGYANALGVPVVGLSVSKKLNLMLAASCEGIIESPEQLDVALTDYKRLGYVRTDALPKFEGHFV